MKKALITGITGQDGAYLAELLLKKGYEVHGIKRRSSLFNTDRIDHLYQDPHIDNRNFVLHFGDLSDSTNLIRIIQQVQPDEIYNLGAMSHVKVSFDTPEYTANVDAVGSLRLLEAIRILKLENKTYGIYACNGILFNHESPLRGETFVTRKITRAVSKIALGLQDNLYLGNLNAKRDWGHAKDYVEAMYLILQQPEPDDYVIATGKTTEVREFVRMAFAEVGIEVEFKGTGVEEKGYIKSCSNPAYQVEIGKEVVAVDPRYFRPTEVDLLIGDPTKSNTKLGWYPKHDLASLVKDMMDHDIKLFERDKYLLEGGHKIFNYHE